MKRYGLRDVRGLKICCRAVPMASLPGSCGNNSTVLGIASTPVIDPTGTPAGTPAIYVMAYTLVGASSVYMLHKLDASTLTDILPSSPVTVSASQTLSSVRSVRALPFDKLRSCDVCGRQRGFLIVPAGAHVIVVVCCNVYSSLSICLWQ
jgi:hypothetical protein